jgi:hypothetical protein
MEIAHVDIPMSNSLYLQGARLTANIACFGFLLSFYMNPWIENQGHTKAFGTMAAIAAAIMVMAISIYSYGKKIRVDSLKWAPVRLVHWNEDRETGE